jgi:hypothetical protein
LWKKYELVSQVEDERAVSQGGGRKKKKDEDTFDIFS